MSIEITFSANSRGNTVKMLYFTRPHESDHLNGAYKPLRKGRLGICVDKPNKRVSDFGLKRAG